MISEMIFAATGSVLGNALFLLVLLAAPFFAFAFVIHFLERIIQRRLAERFGWKSVLWTGWLGTPIHELSHAAFCLMFNHRIDDMALFEPDKESGRLGYVRHTWRKGNWFAELGNVFIGIAPLLGGSIALALLLWMFYPDVASSTVEIAREDNSSGISAIVASVIAICGAILNPVNFFTLRFWVFLYLVLCVGSHMAPSGSDYAGARRGVLLLCGILGTVTLLLAFFQADLESTVFGLINLLSPLFALFALTIALCIVATIAVYGFTSFMPRLYRFR